MRRRVQVRAMDIMTRAMITVDSTASIREAAIVLLDAGISGAPVCDRFGRIVGLFSLRDIARFERERGGTPEIETLRGRRSTELPWGFHFEDDPEATVQQYMTPILVTVVETANLSQVIRTMMDRKVHRVLVRNDDGEIVGLVSALDILHSMLAEPSVEALSAIA